MLNLESLKSALRNNKVEISAHAELCKIERDIPIYSILHALPLSEATARSVVDKKVKSAIRFCVNRTMYSLELGDLMKGITLITEYNDRVHVAYADEYFFFGRCIPKGWL